MCSSHQGRRGLKAIRVGRSSAGHPRGSESEEAGGCRRGRGEGGERGEEKEEEKEAVLYSSKRVPNRRVGNKVLQWRRSVCI